MRHLFGNIGLGCLCTALVCSADIGCAGSAFTSSESMGGAASGGKGSGGTGNGGRAAGGVAHGGAISRGGASSGGVATGGASVAGSANGGAAAGALGSGGSASGGVAGAAAISTEGLLLWLAADRGVTTSSGAVSKWLDQSDSHADATQVVASARPKLSNSGKLPMIEFDGVDDALALPEGFSDFSQGLSFFGVVESIENPTCTSILQLSNGPELQDIDFGRQQASIHYEDYELYVTGPADAFPEHELKLLGVVHATSGEAELRIDGQYMTSTNLMLPPSLPRTANFVGRTLYSNCAQFNGRVGELLVYSRALSSAERTRVEAYLQQKWACCGAP